MNIGRSGRELKAIRDEIDVSDAEILIGAKVSMTTLHKIFREEPTVRPRLRRRVEEAIMSLKSRPKASA